MMALLLLFSLLLWAPPPGHTGCGEGTYTHDENGAITGQYWTCGDDLVWCPKGSDGGANYLKCETKPATRS